MVNSTGKYLRGTQMFYVIFTRVSRVDLMRKSSSLILGLAVCSEVTADVARMDTKIEATSDVAHLRRSAMLYSCDRAELSFEILGLARLKRPLNELSLEILGRAQLASNLPKLELVKNTLSSRARYSTSLARLGFKYKAESNLSSPLHIFFFSAPTSLMLSF
jgi:hypothetical protein